MAWAGAPQRLGWRSEGMHSHTGLGSVAVLMPWLGLGTPQQAPHQLQLAAASMGRPVHMVWHLPYALAWAWH